MQQSVTPLMRALQVYGFDRLAAQRVTQRLANPVMGPIPYVGSPDYCGRVPQDIPVGMKQ